MFDNVLSYLYSAEDKIRLSLKRPLKARSIDDLIEKSKRYSLNIFEINGIKVIHDYRGMFGSGHRTRMIVRSTGKILGSPTVVYQSESDFVPMKVGWDEDSKTYTARNDVDFTAKKILMPDMLSAEKKIVKAIPAAYVTHTSYSKNE